MRVCILWHMHQPDYRLPGEGGRAAMPWVRLHAASNYLDMALLAKEAPANVHVTFNLTACLLEQLDGLAAGRHGDAFLDVARKDAKDLTEAERLYALEHFFSANEERKIRPFPRWLELKERRARARASGRLLESFSDDDLRDLSVYFLLAWTGQRLRRDERVQHLLAKARSYKEDEKRALLALHDEQARAILPLYASLAKEGKIEVSTTPLYHPILPLLVDVRTASEARRGCSVEGIEFRAPEDAKRQVELGLARTEKLVGVRPRGMWPSEGSVSEAVLGILGEAGVEWCATDQQILGKSERETPLEPPHLTPWRLRGSGPAVFFRDTALSDLVGFTYSRWDAARAADDLVARIVELGRRWHGSGQPIVPVILDGENAWEFYAQNGEPFLRALYERLGATRGLEATTFSRALASAQPGKLATLAPGSWIRGDLDTWAGHPEKNRAWQLLAATRRELQDASREKPAPEEASEALLRAEGSDWFWWLGDDHPTDYFAEFDALFRRNLAFVAERIGRKVDGLDEPIARRRPTLAVEAPLGLISPRIDGLARRYYDWIGSGVLRVQEAGSAMRLGAAPLAVELRFGFDEESLYLRLSPRNGHELREATVKVVFEGAKSASWEWSRPQGLRGAGGGEPSPARAACEKVFELAVPRVSVGLGAGARSRVVVELSAADGRRERVPQEGALELVGPDEFFDSRNWTL